MPAFAPKGDFSFSFVVLVGIELDAPINQFLNGFRAVFHDFVNDIVRAETGSGVDSVFDVLLESILITLNAGDATLRPGGIRWLPLFSSRSRQNRAPLPAVQN